MKNKRFTRFTMRLWYTFAMSTVNLAMSVTRNQHRPTSRPSHRRWHGGGNEARSAKFHDWQSCIVFYEKTAGLRNEKLGHFISYLNHSKPINHDELHGPFAGATTSTSTPETVFEALEEAAMLFVAQRKQHKTWQSFMKFQHLRCANKKLVIRRSGSIDCHDMWWVLCSCKAMCESTYDFILV